MICIRKLMGHSSGLAPLPLIWNAAVDTSCTLAPPAPSSTQRQLKEAEPYHGRPGSLHQNAKESMATRTLASDRDRKMTILLTPFMSCSAKIPIYAVFCAAFFARYQALVMIGLYVAGIVIGILVALLLKGGPLIHGFFSMLSVCGQADRAFIAAVDVIQSRLRA